MGRIELFRFDKDDEVKSLALNLRYETNRELVGALITDISTDENLSNDIRACYLFGEGSHRKAEYLKLERSKKIKILWQGFFGPWWLKPLGIVAAGHGGLIKILDTGILSESFMMLSNLSMVTLYSIDRTLESEIVEHVRLYKWRSNIDNWIMNDSSHFRIMVDGDNAESSSGIYSIVTCGRECPSSLQEKAQAKSLSST